MSSLSCFSISAFPKQFCEGTINQHSSKGYIRLGDAKLVFLHVKQRRLTLNDIVADDGGGIRVQPQAVHHIHRPEHVESGGDRQGTTTLEDKRNIGEEVDVVFVSQTVAVMFLG